MAEEGVGPGLAEGSREMGHVMGDMVEQSGIGSTDAAKDRPEALRDLDRWARGDLTCEFVRRGLLRVRVDWEREALLRVTVKVTLMSFSDLAT